MLVKSDEGLNAALRRSEEAGLPAISVSASQGKMLMLLAMTCRAQNILEIGTLGAYSTIWLARGLVAGGRLITLEAEPRHAEVARRNLEAAGLASVVELRSGKALETLPQVEEERRGPFDLIFIDADKANLPAYFQWAVRLAHEGTVIVIDNVVRKGAVLDTSGTDASVAGVRRMNELMAAEPRVSATTIQTVGTKGYDGFTLAVVTG
jgi:predicted O-methyltransferase YrrM